MVISDMGCTIHILKITANQRNWTKIVNIPCVGCRSVKIVEKWKIASAISKNQIDYSTESNSLSIQSYKVKTNIA